MTCAYLKTHILYAIILVLSVLLLSVLRVLADERERKHEQKKQDTATIPFCKGRKKHG